MTYLSIYVRKENNMRVIGGIYKRRLLTWPDDAKHIRPTKDRIREAIFSALGPLDGLTSLDLYSGSGAMGIESLSRGCSFATFVDCNKVALETTKNNLSSLGIKNARVIAKRDSDAIASFIQNEEKFDVLFLDPPYEEGKYEDIIETFISNNLLNAHAIIVIEANRTIEIPESWCIKRKDYQYGEVKVIILWR